MHGVRSHLPIRGKSLDHCGPVGALADVFSILGSNLNPVLTQLTKTRRAVFVEGKDFQIIGRFAQRLSEMRVAGRTEFATVPVEGFNPDRIRTLKKGIETTLGGKIVTAAILDRDYRSQDECEAITKVCSEFCELVRIHDGKEIENYVLSATAIDRASARKVADRARRTGKKVAYTPCAAAILATFAAEKKNYVTSQYLASRRRFARSASPGTDEATANEAALTEFDMRWSDEAVRLAMVPGKEAFQYLNQTLQGRYSIGVTPVAVIDAMAEDEVPDEMKVLVRLLSEFTKSHPGSRRG